MRRLLRKFISILLFTIFLLGSGTGQLIHAAFHKHDFIAQQQAHNTAISLQHTYCNALQLMLPEFSGSGIINISCKISVQAASFSNIEISIPLIYSFKTSDRAPPVIA